jgi:ABC-type lipoprotein release transport system permease subunit
MTALSAMALNRKHTASATSFGLWLSWRELNSRRLVFAFNVIIIAFLIALPVMLDLMGRARQASVDSRMDYMGPSMSLVPQGTSSYDLATGKMEGQPLPENTVAGLLNDYSELLKAAEPRLITRLPVEGRPLTVIGIDFSNVHSYPLSQFVLQGQRALIGRVAAEKLGMKPGGKVRIRSQEFQVTDIIPTTGSIEDASIFVPLASLQKITGLNNNINEIRLFPRSADAIPVLKQSLRTYYSHLTLVDSYRGDVVEKDLGNTLTNYQKAVYTAAFVLIALCIVISTYINLESRKAEIATFYTLGTRKGILFRVLALRTVWLALLGAVAGHALGIVAVLTQDIQASIFRLWSWSTFLAIVAGTVALGLAVTIPFMFLAVFKRDLLADL